MQNQPGKCMLAMVTLAAAGSIASADVLFDNRGLGIDSPDIFSSDIRAWVLEDGRFPTSAAHQITAINIGYHNTDPAQRPLAADVLVRFWDTVNYDVIPVTSAVHSGPIGPEYRFSIVAQPGANETGLLLLPGGGVLLADNDWGVMIDFVLPGTSTPLAGINHLFRDVPVTLGSSDALFGCDEDGNGIVSGTELFTWEGGGFPAGNMYLQIHGTAIPEASAAIGVAVAGIGLAGRRPGRRRVCSGPPQESWLRSDGKVFADGKIFAD
ncbi:hypothetical protein [Fontivita pretiosa]|uniref:hypothetical protein n=1 Tax=Fontivita pretiosa TaxID=2989684 RepID=UPI003D171F2F